MKFHLLISAVIAVTMLDSFREQANGIFSNAVVQYNKIFTCLKSQMDCLKNFFFSKIKKPIKEKVVVVNEEEEEPNSEQIREFLEQITKHFEELKKRNEDEGIVENDDMVEEMNEKSSEHDDVKQAVKEELL